MVSNLQVRPKESEEGEKAGKQDGLQALAATAERREQRHQVSEQARGEVGSDLIFSTYRHPAAAAIKSDKREKSEESQTRTGDVNLIIKKILRQQTHLRSHIARLESKNSSGTAPVQPEPEKRSSESSQVSHEGKGYIMKTFLENMETEDFYSHDSGIGSALATITDWSISKESEPKSLDLADEVEHHQPEDEAAVLQFIAELEKLIDINDKIADSEQQIEKLSIKLDDVRNELTVRGKEDVEKLQDEVEVVTKINSSKSHEIKKNDIAISHMEKNIQGRQTFLTTIELDINRAESYAKRLQKEFEREFETVGLCNDILTVCNEELSNDSTEKELNEENCDNDEADDLIRLSDDDYQESHFSVSATQNPFGALSPT